MEGESRFYEKCTGELVTAVTGFQEGEENHKLCVDFALSHFIARVHPDVDWFKVKRKILGLCERYLIESDLPKSRKLQQLTDSFFEAVSKEPIPEKSVSYSALWLVCNLCGAGAEAGLLGKKKAKHGGFEAGDSEVIDWCKYLHEDDISAHDYSDDESVWSDLESLSELSLDLKYSPKIASVDSGIGETPDAGTAPLFPPLGPFQPYKEPSRKPLKLIKPYWNLQYKSYCTGIFDSYRDWNFTSFWENHLAERIPIYTPQTNAVLNETNILREILWMLHGVKSTYMFKWINNQFQVRKHVHLKHLTEGTLYKMLSCLCPYGSKMVHLQNFLFQTLTDEENRIKKCHTYKAYANGMWRCLQKYMNVLTAYEKVIIDQSESLTIIQLTSKLKEHFNYLDLLHAVHVRAIDAVPLGSSHFMRATALLDALWKEVAHCSLCVLEKSHLQSILLLFIASFHPYLCMIEASVVRGELIDPCSEFVIQRNADVKIKDSNFWQNGLMLQSLSKNYEHYFLSSVMEEIMRASLSTQMLKTLDSFYDTECCAKYPQDPLFSSFLTKFETVYKYHTEKLPLLDDSEEDSNSSESSCEITCTGNDHSQEYDYHFQALNRMTSDCICLVDHNELCNRVLDIIHPGSLLLLNDVLEYSLLPSIKSICLSAKRALVQELKDKYHLMEHVSIMKKYFLMESGDKMFTFYTEIFEKIFCGEDWCNNTYINHIFKDANMISYSDEDKNLLLYINEGDTTTNSDDPLYKLSLLNLTYDVGWPISIILSPYIQSIYCEVFRFLMQVKCAKSSLDDLYCFPLKPSAKALPKVAKWWTKKEDMFRNHIIHSMYILRMKLLHFINGFHSYIMTSILHCSWLELDTKLEAAESLGDILSSLHSYAHGLQEQCFLNAKHPHLQEQIHNILNLALRYQAVWRSGIEKISIDDLRNIENEFITRFTLVTTYLKKPWKRGEHLHLEILANSISTNCHLQRLFV